MFPPEDRQGPLEGCLSLTIWTGGRIIQLTYAGD
jgi:hypothetical protein